MDRDVPVDARKTTHSDATVAKEFVTKICCWERADARKSVMASFA
jgi:hypothetical protein